MSRELDVEDKLSVAVDRLIKDSPRMHGLDFAAVPRVAAEQAPKRKIESENLNEAFVKNWPFCGW